jgi:hypothetical protein
MTKSRRVATTGAEKGGGASPKLTDVRLADRLGYPGEGVGQGRGPAREAAALAVRKSGAAPGSAEARP